MLAKLTTRRLHMRYMLRNYSPFPPSTVIFHFNYSPNYSYGCTVGNKTEFLASAELTEEEFQENPIINWDAILWVNRPVELWSVQLVLALISLTEALLLTYLGYKVSNYCPNGTVAFNVGQFHPLHRF